MANLREEKAVLVRVYVERPRKRRSSSSSSSHSHHHHHHYVRHIIKQELTLHNNGDSGKGYSRRAELLHYSQRLRESARSATSSPLVPKPVSSNHNHHHQPRTNIVAAPSKPRYSRSSSPTCLGNWKILIPNICRSLTSLKAKEKKKKKGTGSTSNAMRAVMKRLEVQKKKRSILKLLSKLQRHR